MDVETMKKRMKVLDKALEIAIEFECSGFDGKPLSRSMVKYMKLAYIFEAERALEGETKQVMEAVGV